MKHNNFISLILTLNNSQVKMVTKPIAKSEMNNIQWYLWKISLELSRVFNDNLYLWIMWSIHLTLNFKVTPKGNSFYTKEKANQIFP